MNPERLAAANLAAAPPATYSFCGAPSCLSSGHQCVYISTISTFSKVHQAQVPRGLTKQQIVANYLMQGALVASETALRDCAACDARCSINIKVEVPTTRSGDTSDTPPLCAAMLCKTCHEGSPAPLRGATDAPDAAGAPDAAVFFLCPTCVRYCHNALQAAKRCRIHRIDRDVNMRDSISFVLFLHRVIHPSVARNFLHQPERVNRSHGLFTHNTKTPENRPYIQALAIIARARCDPVESYPLPSTPSIDNAVVYVAFHQFFSTQKYIGILALKRADDDDDIETIRALRTASRLESSQASTDIMKLHAATLLGPIDTPYGALAAAKKRKADAIIADRTATHNIRLLENYRHNFLLPDIERVRDALKVRASDDI